METSKYKLGSQGGLSYYVINMWRKLKFIIICNTKISDVINNWELLNYRPVRYRLLSVTDSIQLKHYLLTYLLSSDVNEVRTLNSVRYEALKHL